MNHLTVTSEGDLTPKSVGKMLVILLVNSKFPYHFDTNKWQKSYSYPFAQEYSILIFPQINPCISVGRFLNDSKRSHDIQEFLIRVIAASIKVAVEPTSVLSLPVTMDPDKSSTQFRYSPEFESEGFKQQVESYKLSLCGRKLTWAIATVTGTGFTLFGCASTIMSIKMLTGL